MQKVTDIFEIVEPSKSNPERNKAIAYWLMENTDSHLIQSHADMVAAFEKDLAEFGVRAPWLSFSYRQTKRLMEMRGLGGTLEKSEKRLCYGYDMAEACAWEFAQFHTDKYGRGSRFRDCIQALLNG